MVRLSDVFGPDGSPKVPSKEGEISKPKPSSLPPSENAPPPSRFEIPSPTSPPVKRQQAVTLYKEALEWVRKKFAEAVEGPISDIAGALEIVERLVKALSGNGEDLLALTSVWKEENYLYPHSVNVAILSIKVGQGLHSRQEDLLQLGIAALVHDLGMAKVPRALVEKDAPLSGEEKDIVKKHPIYTVQLLQGIKGLDRAILDAVSHEHERLDGSGYPRGLREDQVSEYGGIIALVDVYEALTHPRPYRKRHTPDEAMKLIAYSMGEQFRVNLIRVLKALIKELSVYPVGSFVQLNTKEVAQVIKVNKNFPILPIVDVYLDVSGNRLSEIKRIDLAQEPLIHIKKAVDIFEMGKAELWLSSMS